MLNKKGFTLVELLAVMVVLGVLMTMTVPNIIGITTANRQQTYAEDAKKMVSTAEYLIRGNDTMIKPNNEKWCVVLNLAYLGMSEFDTAPYGGSYDPYESYVVMKYETLTSGDNFGSTAEYRYYVQLYEKLNDGEGWRGIKLTEVSNLDGDGYLDVGLSETSQAPYLDAVSVNINPKSSVFGSNAGLKKQLLFTDKKCTYSEFMEGTCVGDDVTKTDSDIKKYLAGRIHKDYNVSALCGTYGSNSINAYYLGSGKVEVEAAG